MALSRRARAFAVLWSSAVFAATADGTGEVGDGACAEAVASDSKMAKANLIGSCKLGRRLYASGCLRDDPGLCLGQPASTAPPLTLKISPDMNPAISVQRKTMGPAISAGVPTRPRGIVPKTAAEIFASANAPADMSVSTQPGATLFT